MIEKKRSRVALYGHLTYDTVFDGVKKSERIGAMGNVYRALKELEAPIAVELEPTDIGEAIVLIDTINSRRTSIPHLNIHSKAPSIQKATWSHVMYLNELSNPDYVYDLPLDSIVSADISGARPVDDFELLECLDYLFISTEDLDSKLEYVEHVTGTVIAHSPDGCTTYTNRGNVKTYIDNELVLKDINVLGAGDMFAAAFIEYKVSLPKGNLHDAIAYAQKKTRYLLKKYNEES